MATQANIGRWKFRKATVGSPATFTDIEEVVSISGVGQTGEDIDVTNFDSPTGTKEFIAGLKEGDEVSVECNYVPGATEQEALLTAIEAGVNIQFQAAYIAVSPEKTFTFAGSPKGYSITPSPTEANLISFAIKISGDITRA